MQILAKALGACAHNLVPGRKCAEAVKDYLVSFGIYAARIDTISYGKEKRVCVESNETCWAQNRQAVIAITLGTVS